MAAGNWWTTRSRISDSSLPRENLYPNLSGLYIYIYVYIGGAFLKSQGRPFPIKQVTGELKMT